MYREEERILDDDEGCEGRCRRRGLAAAFTGEEEATVVAPTRCELASDGHSDEGCSLHVEPFMQKQP